MNDGSFSKNLVVRKIQQNPITTSHRYQGYAPAVVLLIGLWSLSYLMGWVTAAVILLASCLLISIVLDFCGLYWGRIKTLQSERDSLQVRLQRIQEIASDNTALEEISDYRRSPTSQALDKLQKIQQEFS